MKNIQFQFSDRSVVVTGAAQGIGFQIARDFLEAGAKVYLWDYSEAALSAAKAELSRYQDRAEFVAVDVTKMASCEAAAARLSQKLDILVNNAGITRDKSFVKMTSEEWQAVIDTNLTGLFNVTKSVFEKFDPTRTAKRIVNISSVVALYGNFGQTNYVAAKAGVIGMTKTWAREFAKKGFTVNAIAPGFVRTKMVEKMPPEVLSAIVAKVPAGRMADPADISNAVMFLSSEEAGYITGTVVSVDGALVA